jgi:hypothetical protein
MMGEEEDRIENTGDRIKSEERWPKLSSLSEFNPSVF